ncbi:MAG: ArsR/SmtB family transcription factor [Acidimicrobiales bacterium]
MPSSVAVSTEPDPAADPLPVLRALADPTRLRLFSALRVSERCVKDLVDAERVPQPLVSHHLRVLVDAGLVTVRRADGFNLYAVDPEGLGAAQRATGALLDPTHLDPAAQPGGNTSCCQPG